MQTEIEEQVKIASALLSALLTVSLTLIIHGPANARQAVADTEADDCLIPDVVSATKMFEGLFREIENEPQKPIPVPRPRPLPPKDTTPEVLIDRALKDLLPLLGLTCKVTAYATDEDIQRPPGTTAPEGTSSQQDPTGVTIPIKYPDGSCECRIAIETEWLCKPVSRRKPRVNTRQKMAHELCHCLQAEKGVLPSREGPEGPGPAGTATDFDIEKGADLCAAQLIKGDKPTIWLPESK